MSKSADGHGRRVLLGLITGAHGIRGEVVVRTFTTSPEGIGQYGPLADEGGRRTFVFTVRRMTPKGVIAAIQGIGDRTEAEKLQGTKLYVGRERLPKPGPNEYYHFDLVGLSAFDVAGAAVGEVVAVHNFGAGDILEIQPGGGGPTVLHPFNSSTVSSVDLESGRIVVVMPDDGDDGDNTK